MKVHFVIIISSAFCFKHLSAVRSEAAEILYSLREKHPYYEQMCTAIVLL